jgi:glutamate dehydrogenase
MSLADRPRSKLVLVRSLLGRHLFAFVWLPRDESRPRAARRSATCSPMPPMKLLNWSIALEDGVVALMRYTLDLRGGGVMPDGGRARRAAGADGARLGARGRGGAGRAGRQRRRARRAWHCVSPMPSPRSIAPTSTPEEAARDILRIATLDGAGDRSVRITPHPTRKGQYRLKLYAQGGALALSDAVPVFENFGFRVIEEVPTAARQRPGFVHDFEVALTGTGRSPMRGDPGRGRHRRGARRPRRERRVQPADRRGRHARRASVVLFRAWFRYLRQTGMTYGLVTVVDALRRAPKVAAALIERFEARTIPARRQGRRRDQGRGKGDRRRARPGLGDRRRPHPAALRGVIARDAAHQRLAPAGQRRSRSRSIQRQGPRPAGAAAVARDLGLFARASRASICAPARSRAAACAGPTGATISAPRSSG